MSKIKLDQEEQGILDAFDGDEFESVITDDRRSDLVQVLVSASHDSQPLVITDDRRSDLVQAAEETLKKVS
ncbi:MAG: hypothetical protein Q8Q40_05550 [Methylococcaceae bacterium]|nr:hypothetical protein [Methylococcaceae bacterium]MDP3903420.1 hypothetical protein [Methylococcaceae bacterium]